MVWLISPDIDECVESEKVECLETEYCNNIQGGYECVGQWKGSPYWYFFTISLSLSLECNFACKHSCTGGGDGNCVECRDGFHNVSGHCKGKLINIYKIK